MIVLVREAGQLDLPIAGFPVSIAAKWQRLVHRLDANLRLPP